MGNCKKVLNLLNEYIDGELSETDAAFVRAHLETCETCKKAYNELLDIEKIFEEAQEEAPAELCENVMSKIKTEKSLLAKHKKFTKIFGSVAIAAAISLTVLASPAILMVATGGAKAECDDIAQALAPSENAAGFDNYYSDTKLEIMDAVTDQVKFDGDADDISGGNISDGTEAEATVGQGKKYTACLSDGSATTLIISENFAILGGREYKYEISENKYILTADGEMLSFIRVTENNEIIFRQTEEAND